MHMVLALTMLLDYSCTDQYQPNMPHMAREFRVSQAQMGSTIQIHLFSCALGMLVVGSLSDRVGRRPVILACQAMQAVSTFTCMCAPHIGWFMVGRVLQGLAASVYVVILASLRDCYPDPAHRQQMMGTLMSLMLVGPIFAPGLGGLLGFQFGWRYPFGLLAIASALLTAAGCVYVHETACKQAESNYPTELHRTVNCRKRVSILICVGTTKSLFDVVIATNGFILEDYFGLTILQTSLFTALFAVACALGSMLSGRLRQAPADVLQMFVPLMLLSAVTLILAGMWLPDSIAAYLSCIAFLQLVVFPPIIAYHTEFTQDLQDIAGVATSVDLSSQYFLSSIISLPGIVAAQNSIAALFFTLAGTVLITELITWIAIRPSSTDPREAPLHSEDSLQKPDLPFHS